MRVNLPVGLTKLVNKMEKKEEAQVKTNNPAKSDTLSFMSIPSIAFTGKLVVPKLPKGMKASPDPVLSKDSAAYLNKLEKEPTFKYLAYPQDPLVTPEPELYSVKGEVVPGPESNRIKINHHSEKAQPSANGNYIADVNTPQFDRVNVFAFTQKVLNMYEQALGRKIHWAFNSEQLKSDPLAGVTMNAYYSRNEQTTKFFYFDSRTNPTEKCYTSKMADVVTHETGHATLDGLRPSYIGWGHHGGAIHEGFSDTTAMLVAMENDTVLDKVIEQTKGDLRKENLIASLAEQFGKAVYGDKLYLRNAINELTLGDYNSGRESKQVHNFGRLLAGTNYSILSEMTMYHEGALTLKGALKKSKEDFTKILARAMGDFSPPGNVYYNDVGKAILKAASVEFNGVYKDMVKKVLLEREILTVKEVGDWEAEQAAMPKLSLPPKVLDSKETVLDFVNRNKELLGLPLDSKYELESAYSNNFGETFIQLKAGKMIEVPPKDPMDDPTYRIRIYGGLTLAFDKEGKLFYKAENKTHGFEIQDAIEDAQNVLSKQKEAHIAGAKPVVYRENNNDNVLVKIPKIEDPIN
ncbi:MAG: hypothetical protein AB1782_11280 [Cyanobacteriota bacterium]